MDDWGKLHRSKETPGTPCELLRNFASKGSRWIQALGPQDETIGHPMAPLAMHPRHLKWCSPAHNSLNTRSHHIPVHASWKCFAWFPLQWWAAWFDYHRIQSKATCPNSQTIVQLDLRTADWLATRASSRCGKHSRNPTSREVVWQHRYTQTKELKQDLFLSSWWLNQTICKKMIVKSHHVPNFVNIRIFETTTQLLILTVFLIFHQASISQ